MSENSIFAAYFGSLVDVCLDPVVIIAGALLGLAAWQWWQRILGSFILALVIAIAFGARVELQGGLPVWWLLLSQTLAVFVWSAAGALARLILDGLLAR